MYTMDTGDLSKVLKETEPSLINEYSDKNKEELLTGSKDFANYMNEVIAGKGLLKQDVFIKADISLRYGYKLLNEEKYTRQRDVILRICYAAGLTLEETQRALKIYHMDILYERDLRDALLITCFEKGYTDILTINKYLLANKMKPLRTSGLQE